MSLTLEYAEPELSESEKAELIAREYNLSFVTSTDEPTTPCENDIVVYSHSTRCFQLKRGDETLKRLLPTGETLTEWDALGVSDPTCGVERITRAAHPPLAARLIGTSPTFDRWTLMKDPWASRPGF